MNLRITHPDALRGYHILRECGPRGRALADVLEQRGTRVRVTPKIYGGFTLNFINTIFIMPPRAGGGDIDFKYWVSLLGHEASHIEQRYWIDSVEQEINAYTTQAQLGDELGINLDYLKRGFAHLNPKSPSDQLLARTALLTLFVGTPAAIVYASLPLIQPRGMHSILPGARELTAVLRAAFHPPPQPA